MGIDRRRRRRTSGESAFALAGSITLAAITAAADSRRSGGSGENAGLTPKLDPRAFTLRTVRARLDAKGDLAAPLLAGGVSLARALAQLRAQT